MQSTLKFHNAPAHLFSQASLLRLKGAGGNGFHYESEAGNDQVWAAIFSPLIIIWNNWSNSLNVLRVLISLLIKTKELGSSDLTATLMPFINEETKRFYSVHSCYETGLDWVEVKLDSGLKVSSGSFLLNESFIYLDRSFSLQGHGSLAHFIC